MDLTEAIDRFRGPLVGLIVSWGVPYVDATELAQDSFATAYLNRDHCRGDWQQPEVFGPWLYGIAKNQFRNWSRSRQRRQRRFTLVDNAILDQTAAAKHPAPGDQTSGNQASVDLGAGDSRLHDLRKAIDKLPTKQRQVVLMHYLEETSVKDVAALLSVTPKAVEGRLYQARRMLKRMLDQPQTSGIAKALML